MTNTHSQLFRTWPPQVLLATLFGVVLSLAFLNHSSYYLAWVAYVPMLFATERATLIRTYALGVIAGVFLFASGSYWIFDFILISKGGPQAESLLLSLLFWLYCAQQPALVFTLFKWLRERSGVHEFILFPVLVASFTSAFPMLFATRLGETQINFYSALQATEFVGVHGLDAIIALSNIVLFRLLYMFIHGDSNRTPNISVSITVSILIIVLWLAYGRISFLKWEEKQTNWKTSTIGIVQPNEVPNLGKSISYPGFSKAYPPEMAMTERLAKQGAELIIWPEAQPKNYLNNINISSAYQSNMARLNTSLLFQDTEQIINPTNREVIKQFNSAIMIDHNGRQTGQYQKLKRIPFGEYIPIISDNSFFRNKVRSFLGDFLNEISKGKGYQAFNHKDVTIIPLICYETTYPTFVANAIKHSTKSSDQSKSNILVALSNDGWFGSTHLPYQHVMSSVLRAVENRLPLIHVANNGPSIVVSPNGQVTFTSDFQRAGGYITQVPLSNDSQGSFYSRHPSAFKNSLYAILILSILLSVTRLFDSDKISIAKK